MRLILAEVHYVEKLKITVSAKDIGKCKSLLRTIGRIEKRLNKSHNRFKEEVDRLTVQGKQTSKVIALTQKSAVFLSNTLRELSLHTGTLPHLISQKVISWEAMGQHVLFVAEDLQSWTALQRQVVEEMKKIRTNQGAVKAAINVYIIPGAGEDATKYTRLINMIKERGHSPVPIVINWKSKSSNSRGALLNSPLAWVQQARLQIESYEQQREGSPKIIVGFSYGGVIALYIHHPRNSSRILCSVPNVFNTALREELDKITSKYAGLQMNWEELDSMALSGRSNGWDIFLCDEQEQLGKEEVVAYGDSMRGIIGTLKWESIRSQTVKNITQDSRSMLANIKEVMQHSRFFGKKKEYLGKHYINSPTYVAAIAKAIKILEKEVFKFELNFPLVERELVPGGVGSILP